MNRLVFTLLPCLLAPAWATDSAQVEAEVLRQLAEHDTARIVVEFHEPSPRLAGSTGQRRALRRATGDAIIADHLPPGALRHRFEHSPVLVMQADRQTMDRLAHDPRVRSISTDPGGSGGVAVAASLTRIDQVHHPIGPGLTGAGVRVAVLDSGIDRNHPDFSGRIISEACFCSGGNGCCPSGQSSQSGPGAARDDHGHGTRVTGVLAGGGARAAPGGAPDAEIIAVRVLDQDNRFCCASDIAAAFDWVALNHPEAQVVNVSLQTDALFGGDCDTGSAWQRMLANAVAALEANGTLVVSIAGNSAQPHQLSAPGCLSRVMAVGGTYAASYGPRNYAGCSDPVTAADRVICWSNGGAQMDLFAPAAFLISSNRGGGVAHGLSGTSYAAPLVAGCAAALYQSPTAQGLTPAAMRQALMASPVVITDPRTGRSRPRLDCLEALSELGGLESDQPIDRGLSGSWYDPATSGQGFLVEVIESRDPPELVMYWFTHASEPGGPEALRWFTAQGPYQRADSRAELEIYQSIGGRFDRAEPPTATESVGTATVVFHDCHSATLDYHLLPDREPAPLAGQIALSRLTPPIDCPAND